MRTLSDIGETERVGVWQLIREDLSCHYEGLLALGFWALVIYRCGHAALAIRPRWLRAVFRAVHLFFFKLSEMLLGISIPAQVSIGRRFAIEHSGGVVVHGCTVIGDDCLIRQGVTIGMRRRSDPLGTPRLGNRVEVGAGAKILGRITIGDDAMIGANSVVLDDVPPACVAIGVPATIRPRRSKAEPDA